MNEPILFQRPVQTGSCSGPQVPLWEPTGNFPTIGKLQRLTMDLKPLASRSWRAFVADCVSAQGPSCTRRNAEVAAKSDVSTFQIGASKHRGGNKYASCGRTCREWFLASERRYTAPTRPQP